MSVSEISAVSLPPVVFRADARWGISSGHFMRSLALAQAWCEIGGRSIIAYAEANEEIVFKATQGGVETAHMSATRLTAGDAQELTRLAQAVGAQWIVLDGWRFTSEYREILHLAGFRILQVDDAGFAGVNYADCILNPNFASLHGNGKLYSSPEPATCLLLGVHYAPLQREFLRWRAWRRRTRKSGRRVLITCGGADPHNVTLKVLSSLAKVGYTNVEVAVIIGPLNSHRQAVEHFASRLPLPMRIVSNPPDMSQWMIWADVAIAVAGVTTVEMAFLGLPMLLISIDRNEGTVVAEGHRSAGTAVNLGPHEELTCGKIADELGALLCSYTRRESMCESGRALIDGRGGSRVSEFIHGATLS